MLNDSAVPWTGIDEACADPHRAGCSSSSTSRIIRWSNLERIKPFVLSDSNPSWLQNATIDSEPTPNYIDRTISRIEFLSESMFEVSSRTGEKASHHTSEMKFTDSTLLQHLDSVFSPRDQEGP
jgi:hypothetical protein